MDTKKILIVGAVAVLGVGAYFYFKPKSKVNETDSLSGGTSGSIPNNPASSSGTTSVPPTGTTLSTLEKVEENAKRMAEARSLATKIYDLKNKRNSYMNSTLRNFAELSNNSFWSNNESMLKLLRKQQISEIEKEIKDLDIKLSMLGFVEQNGSVTVLP
jgi:hypothetical protein